MLKNCIVLSFSAALLLAQTKEFEVASVKPHKASDDGRVAIQITPGGRWRATNVPLNLLVNLAYELKPGQVSGAPGWINAERYDIDAKLDDSLGSNPKPEQMLPYLQSLLEKRFSLKYHRETKDMQVYSLVVAKSGSKLVESKPDEAGPRIRMGRGQMSATKIDMDLLARELSRQVGRPVMNQTDLKGQYNLELTFTPENAPSGPPNSEAPASAPGGDAPTVFTALQEQLGLKLESKKAPVQMFVIDKIEKAQEN